MTGDARELDNQSSRYWFTIRVPWPRSGQRRVQRDRQSAAKHVRHLALLLGLVGQALELRFAEPRHAATGLQVHARNNSVVQRNRRLGDDRLGHVPLLAQVVRKGHAEAGGVGGRDQLFGIGAFRVLEAGHEGVRRAVEYSAGAVDLAGAALQVAAPGWDRKSVV